MASSSAMAFQWTAVITAIGLTLLGCGTIGEFVVGLIKKA